MLKSLLRKVEGDLHLYFQDIDDHLERCSEVRRTKKRAKSKIVAEQRRAFLMSIERLISACVSYVFLGLFWVSLLVTMWHRASRRW